MRRYSMLDLGFYMHQMSNKSLRCISTIAKNLLLLNSQRRSKGDILQALRDYSSTKVGLQKPRQRLSFYWTRNLSFFCLLLRGCIHSLRMGRLTYSDRTFPSLESSRVSQQQTYQQQTQLSLLLSHRHMAFLWTSAVIFIIIILRQIINISQQNQSVSQRESKEIKIYGGEFIVNLNKINFMIEERILNTQGEDYRLSHKVFNSISISKAFSARSCFEKEGTKEVTYENKIFNIRKKFTVPDHLNEYQPQKKISIVNEQKIRAKPSEIFAKHIDTIIKNRRLLRRGVWEMPFEPDTVVQSKGKNRYKTQASEGVKEKGISCSADYKKKISGSARYLQQERSNQFPQIISGGNTEYDLPVKLLLRKKSKPISCQTADTNQTIQIRNAMSRKLAVELINYNLLGKWASSSFKS